MKGGRKKKIARKVCCFSLTSFFLAGGTTTLHLWEMGKKYCLFQQLCRCLHQMTHGPSGKESSWECVTHFCSYPQLPPTCSKTSAPPGMPYAIGWVVPLGWNTNYIFSPLWMTCSHLVLPVELRPMQAQNRATRRLLQLCWAGNTQLFVSLSPREWTVPKHTYQVITTA